MIGIIDYGAGNLKSVGNALKKIGQKFIIADSPDAMVDADGVILPGVGSAAYAMSELTRRGFLEYLRTLKIPFLGICLGMQILAEYSEEGKVKCLGIFPGKVMKFKSKSLKVPQIGWNKVWITKKSPLFKRIDDGRYFYFVNSYYLPAHGDFVNSRADYGVEFAASIQSGNYFGVQFHPEKSGEIGLKLLNNFCNLC